MNFGRGIGCVLFLCVGSGISSFSEGASQDTSKEFAQVVGKVGNLREGVYWSKLYLDTLKTSRSPARALKKSGPLIWVRVERHEHRMVLHFLDIGGPVEKLEFAENEILLSQYGIQRFSVHVLGTDAFRFTLFDRISGYRESEQPREITYVFEPQSNLLARYSISGDYVDRRGKNYKFKENGEAIFPGRRFNFLISYTNDGDWDTYTETSDREKGSVDEENEYAFRWLGNELHIHRIVDSQVLTVEKRPVLVLFTRSE